MSFTSDALFIIENVPVDQYLENMNGNSVTEYMDALEALFVTQSAKELNRVKFNMIKQDTNETATMFATRVRCLYRIAYPETTENLEKNLNIIDKFLTGLTDTSQKKYVLEHRPIEDDLNALLQ